MNLASKSKLEYYVSFPVIVLIQKVVRYLQVNIKLFFGERRSCRSYWKTEIWNKRIARLQNGYKNSENTEKINIFRKYGYKKARKHAIYHARFSHPNP